MLQKREIPSEDRIESGISQELQNSVAERLLACTDTPANETRANSERTSASPARIERTYPWGDVRNRLPLTEMEEQKVMSELEHSAVESEKFLDRIFAGTPRLVCFGEAHSKLNTMMCWLNEHMKDFHKRGVSHLVLEIEDSYQPEIDKYMKTGNRKCLETGSLEYWAPIIEQARAEGLKVVAVDRETKYEGGEGVLGPLWKSVYSKEAMEARNRHMTGNIAKLLADPSVCAVYYGGKAHLYEGSGETLIDMLAKTLPRSGMRTVIAQQVEWSEDTLTKMLPKIKAPIAFNAKTNSYLGNLRVAPGDHLREEYKYNMWDYVLMVPPAAHSK